mmetsp:Transcript_1025/g.796  ORF Transcript_1025/g.796 Transcript_1025/m.796 type:complete len:310 (-) Transcript_1025:61-990(-)
MLIARNIFNRLTRLYGDYEIEIKPDKAYLGGGKSFFEVCKEVFNSYPDKVYRLGKKSSGSNSFKIRCNGKWLKCYECSSKHSIESSYSADTIYMATKILQENNIPMPKIVAKLDHLIFAEWIEGRQIGRYKSKKLYEKIMEYQCRIHNAEINNIETKNSELIFLKFSIKIFKNYASRYIAKETIDETINYVKSLIPSGLKTRVIHTDFKKSNIILNKNKELIIIDNEMLGLGLGFELDVLSTARNLFRRDKKMQEKYIEKYAKKININTIFKHIDFWELCFLFYTMSHTFRLAEIKEAKILLNKVRENF